MWPLWESGVLEATGAGGRAGRGGARPPRPGAPQRGPARLPQRGQWRSERQAPVLRRGSFAGRKQVQQRSIKGSGRRVLAAAFSDC